MFEILEDGSPYFIRFRHIGIDDLINFAKENFYKVNYKKSLIDWPDASVHLLPLDFDTGLEFFKFLPYKDMLPMNLHRVSYIASKPQSISHLHIDRASISFNYGISIEDDLCTSSWFDKKLIESEYNSVPNMPFDRASVSIPQLMDKRVEVLKSFIQRQGECTLFNSDLYHLVDNLDSPNDRIILTFRLNPPDILNFNDVKKILFPSL